MKKTITRSPFTGAPFGAFGEAAKPLPPAPAFTTQPGTNATTGTANSQTHTDVLFQPGGVMTIQGAAASGVESWQWQKQSGDGSWQNISGRTGATITINSAPETATGVYRVLARNAGGETPSEPVTVTAAFLYLQPLAAGTDPTLTQSADRLAYSGTDTVSATVTAKFIALIRSLAAPTANYMAVTGGLSATTSDADNYPVTTYASGSTARQVEVGTKAAGTATVAVKLAALQSTLTLTVS